MATRRSRGVAAEAEAVFYWDTSAVISTLLRDAHSEKALKLARKSGLHLLSSLAWAETLALIARTQRARALTALLAEAAREALIEGPWRRVNVLPDWSVTLQLSRAWPLRGADLWHLSAAKTLHVELPELRIVSFDEHLNAAAEALAYGHT
jgi:predicted nucleic acid-binding protein